MENITGSAVTAGNYLTTRQFLVDELRRLVLGHSVVIEAPRRFGKTSVIKEFVRQERDKGETSRFHVLFLELEGVSTLDHFCFKLYRSLIELYVIRSCGDWLKNLMHESWNAIASRIPSVGLPEFELELREITRNSDFAIWKERINPLLAGMSKLEKRVVIVFDEFPDMLVNFSGDAEALGFKEAVDALTAWLRSVRQEQQGAIHFSFVFCGSVNLRKTLEEAGLSKRMNDTETLRVPPMTGDEARLLIQALACHYGILLEPAALDFMVDKTVDGPPYFGQVLIKALRDTRRSEISFELLQGIYDSMLRNGDHDLNHFDSRLDDYIPSTNELSCSRIILRTLCVNDWQERELYDYAIATLRLDYTIYQKIVNRLVYEGYLKRDIANAGKLSFISPLLRDWWACKVGVK
jgi:hypothetical protein